MEVLLTCFGCTYSGNLIFLLVFDLKNTFEKNYFYSETYSQFELEDFWVRLINV